jgi:hypothetical protein
MFTIAYVLWLSNRRQQSSDAAGLAWGITFCIGNLAWRVIWLVRSTVRTYTYREVLAIQYASKPMLILQHRRTHVVRPSDGKARIGISKEYFYNVL